MNMRALAARVLCVGFDGAAPDEVPREALRELAPGGLVLFARNVSSVERTERVVDAARAASGAAFVAIDQEGGSVARLRDDVVEIPGMMALGATGDQRLAWRAGRRIARDLRRIGVDLDFAPVLDLAVEPRNTVIGTRSFGSDPRRVGTLAAAFARGLRCGGVAATAKHFPGHGATAVDSHLALPTIEIDRATLYERELVPFRMCVADGIEAVMVGHLAVPALDAERPASISPVAVTQILRGEFGFGGAVFTDCIEMKAIARTIGSAPAAVAALAAGVDCIVVSHHLEVAAAIVEEIVRALDDGRLSPARLEEAASRLSRFGGTAAQDGPEDASIGIEIARRAVCVKRGSIALDARAVTIISFEGTIDGTIGDGVGDPRPERASLNEALRRRGVKSEIMRVPLEPDPGDVRLLLGIVEALGERRLVIVTRRADLYPGQRAAVEALLAARPHAIVVSAREPYDAALFEGAGALACIYGDQAVSFEGLAEVMVPRVR